MEHYWTPLLTRGKYWTLKKGLRNLCQCNSVNVTFSVSVKIMACRVRKTLLMSPNWQRKNNLHQRKYSGWFKSFKGQYLTCIWLPRWLSGKDSAFQGRRCEFSPWVGKIPCRKEWLPTIVLMPGEFHGQSTLGGYSLWGLRVRHDSVTNKFHFHFEVLNVSRLESAMHQERWWLRQKSGTLKICVLSIFVASKIFL